MFYEDVLLFHFSGQIIMRLSFLPWEPSWQLYWRKAMKYPQSLSHAFLIQWRMTTKYNIVPPFCCLLASLVHDLFWFCAQNILPLGRKLGERVITECAMKLKPYLVKFAKHKKSFASKYCEAVASIFEENSDSEKQKDMNSSAHNSVS